MLRSLYAKLLIPAFESGIKRRRTFSYWRQLEASQWLPRHQLEEMQIAGLRRLLVYAAANCAYYRDQWTTLGLDPRSITSREDFERWPTIDRDAIREHRLGMRSTAPDMKLISKATGGSSGVPLQFDLSHDSHDRRMAAWHRGYAWAGAGPGTKQLYFWGVALGGQSSLARYKDLLYQSLYRRKVVSSFDLSDERVPEYLRQINRHRPEVIVAYTNPLYCLAQAFSERRLQPWSPRSIVVGAEKLHSFQRALIEEVFQSPVYETYGSREFMLIGGECDRHAGFHLTMENLLIEVLDDDGRPTPPGEEGNLVITDLHNYGMPFIRYVNGDRAIAGWADCNCGRGLPLLQKVVGRTLDLLETPDGRHIPGEFFPHLLKEFPSVRRFQVVQEVPDRIELRLVLRGAWGDAEQQRLNREVRRVVGPAMGFEIAVVNDIPLTPAGKLSVVVNRCAQHRMPQGVAGDRAG
jgi:phenylacetate-CoA ligase